ncbi:polysaccharide deacteylase family 2 protein [Pontivivens nitratireducens]|uniref:polysaccharide deacteylase family 2 protein n=1 Tax=Pontivivens nitratireducens TaxID=2758038 RepID=UPI00163B3C4D|nr:polysaccharide deacteylase family 2 protein [Pontibrevibacter nitratireducens]
MAARRDGSGFFGGFIGGLVLSVAAFVGAAIAFPPPTLDKVQQIDEIQLPPRLPTLEGQTNTGPVTRQLEATRPRTSEPVVPSSAPAVDPQVNPGSVALAPAPDANEGARSGAPVATAPSDSFTTPQGGVGLNAPETQTATLSVATAPARPRAGINAPGPGLEPAAAPGADAPTANLPRMNADGSLTRPRVTGIQPEVGGTSADAIPQAEPAPTPLVAAPASILPEAEPVSAPVPPEEAPRRIFASNFLAPEGQPLISVVLIDGGTGDFPQETIDALSLPLTVAIPANAPDAVERSRAFRAAGFEVLAMIPQDIATAMGEMDDQGVAETLASVFMAVPEAIGVIDAEGGAMSSDSRVTRAALDYLSLSGHVMVTQAGRGFNQADRLAAAAGVPSATVDRRLDSSLGGAAMVNGLQRVALEARSSGGAMLIGQGNSETITSIVTWAFSPASRAVSLSPVTPLLERFEDSR